jgi:hypothetical protein
MIVALWGRRWPRANKMLAKYIPNFLIINVTFPRNDERIQNIRTSRRISYRWCIASSNTRNLLLCRPSLCIIAISRHQILVSVPGPFQIVSNRSPRSNSRGPTLLKTLGTCFCGDQVEPITFGLKEENQRLSSESMPFHTAYIFPLW